MVNFFKFLLGSIGILMLLSITLGFIITAIVITGIGSGYGIPPSISIISYFILGVFLVWYGFYSDK